MDENFQGTAAAVQEPQPVAGVSLGKDVGSPAERRVRGLGHDFPLEGGP